MYFCHMVIFVSIAVVKAENVGWQNYFIENPTEFHDILLEWESGNKTTVPSWLSGIYVRNGPAQVLISIIGDIIIEQSRHIIKVYKRLDFIAKTLTSLQY